MANLREGGISMNPREPSDQRIQNGRSPLVPNLSDEDAVEEGRSINESFWKLAQAQMGAFAGLLMGFLLGSILGVLGLVVYGDLTGLMVAYWGGIFGMAAGAILFSVIVWKDPY
jgi:hypothetical protein